MPKITQDTSWWKINNRLYKIFHGIKTRCTNFNHPYSKVYSSKGIKCLWKSFENFEKDMGETYKEHVKKFGDKNTTIDRIDNNGSYCKQNCRWATKIEQANNTTKNRFITYNGQTKTMANWARYTGIKYQTLFSRLKKKWSLDRIFTKI